MPPPGRPRPDDEVVREFLRRVEPALDAAWASRPETLPRTATYHRLNRAEYGNAIRDLLALDVDVASMLPPDDVSYGFDNIADALSVSPLLLERYLLTARRVSELAVGPSARSPEEANYFVPLDLTQDDHIQGLPLGTRGGLLVTHHFPLDGEYVIKLRLRRSIVDTIRGLAEQHEIEVAVDRERVALFAIGGKYPCGGLNIPCASDHQARVQAERARAQSENEGDKARANDKKGREVDKNDESKNQRRDEAPKADDTGARGRAESLAYALDADAELEVRLPVRAGPRAVGVAFLRKTAAQIEGIRQPLLKSFIDPVLEGERPPHLHSVRITGPFGQSGPGDTPSRRLIFSCRPDDQKSENECARQIISTLARRAFRRPVTDADLETLLGFYEVGRRDEGSFNSGIRRALQRILVSTDFLFRVEGDQAATTADRVRLRSDVELASRLSFFLWSSIPDDELLDVAERGQLGSPAALERQVERMLKDPRSKALATNFGAQWLYFRNVSAARPDPIRFPEFDENLRRAMRMETEMFFERMIREDRPVLEFLTSDTTFLNERLARHYGVANVYGDHFRRVTLADGRRRGILGHASLLTVTSYANRTSPVLRGKWILENIIGAPPPPPPPSVPAFEETTADGRPRAMREAMEQHRKNPACAGCHLPMDPLGFALENFDAIGRWRTADESGAPIDSSGVLPDGTAFDGFQGLQAALAARSDDFVATLTEKLLTYALGRGLVPADAPVVRQISRETLRKGGRFSAVIVGIAQSTPFRLRKSES
jgi:hypothetical protein